MQQQRLLTREETAVWTWLVSEGIGSAMHGLSSMIGCELTVSSLSLKQIAVKDAIGLLGGPESMAVGIYLTISGDATGRLMLAHDPGLAYELIDMHIGLPPNTTNELGEMEQSVIGEMGDITASSFINAIADAGNMTLIQSPPAVMIGMAGTILDIAQRKIMRENDDVLVVEPVFGTCDRQINGRFLVIPEKEFLMAMLTSTSMAS